MTPSEFITWMKGFAQAANGYNITPKQWDDIKEQLGKVDAATTYQWSESSNSTANIKSLLTDNTVF